MDIGGRGTMSCVSEPAATTTSSRPIDISPIKSSTTTGEISPENDDVSLSLLYNLSTIQDKVHQIQSLVSLLMISTSNHTNKSSSSSGSTSLTMANVESLVQGIITSASSMIFTCQQLHITSNNNKDHEMVMEFSRQEIDHNYDFLKETKPVGVQEKGEFSFPDQISHSLDWYAGSVGQCLMKQSLRISIHMPPDFQDRTSWYNTQTLNPNRQRSKPVDYEILELNAADLLAKYTHYCQICGKGFKRDANLRMHMRAHGDEYKTREALLNPMSLNQNENKEFSLKHFYSCPQQGCRWNQRHEKFQPLKSVICAKNHYKRSHCPKMYMCRRCCVKQFSVLSDLRTHEKHCGDIKWVCSCGTRFSRKDKLLSHVSLFFGHVPVNVDVQPQAQTSPAVVIG